MKISKQTLDFKKNAIVELTELETSSVIGGTGFICSNCLTFTSIDFGTSTRGSIIISK